MLEDDDEPEICNWCNGSGEGMYDGTICSACHGRGIFSVNDLEDEYEKADKWYDERKDKSLGE